MDKNLYNFSVTWHNQKERYVGLCAEFSVLSYLADTDLEAYQGILQLVCEFEEHIEKYQHNEEFGKWLAAKTVCLQSGSPFLNLIKIYFKANKY